MHEVSNHPLSIEQQILSELSSGPLHFSEICNRTGLPKTTVWDNLERLRTVGKVKSGNVGRFLFYALPRDTLPLSSQQQILIKSLGSGPLHVKEIIERTGLSQPAVYDNLKRLKTAGKVKRSKVGRFLFYALPGDTLSLSSQQRILKSLESGPLIVNEISKRVGLSKTTVSDNLKRLETDGKVKSGKVGPYLFYALPRDTLPFLTPNQRNILKSLESGPLHVTEISERTDLSRGTVRGKLKELKIAGRVEYKGKEEKQHFYALPPKEFEETLPPVSVSEQQILNSLESGELFIDQICKHTGLSQTTVDHDLIRLMSLELVDKGCDNQYALSGDYLLYLESKGQTLEGSWPNVLRALIRVRNSGLSPAQIEGIPLEMVHTILEKLHEDGMVKKIQVEKQKILYTLTPRGMQMAAKQIIRFSP